MMIRTGKNNSPMENPCAGLKFAQMIATKKRMFGSESTVSERNSQANRQNPKRGEPAQNAGSDLFSSSQTGFQEKYTQAWVEVNEPIVIAGYGKREIEASLKDSSQD
jgi:hypothetical protein